MHISELASVALIEYDNDLFLINLMIFEFFDKCRELLDSRDDDSGVGVFKLLFQHSGGAVGVCSAFLKSVILFHCLIVEIFSVNNEQHLVYEWKI